MKKITAGEKLFCLIRDEVLDSVGVGHLKWSNLALLFPHLGNDERFVKYIKGAIAIQLMRRLLRYWTETKILLGDESSYVRKISDFVKQDVFPGLTSDLVTKLSRAIIAAETASDRPISKDVRKRVIRSSTTVHCYLCNDRLDPTAGEEHAAHLTLEHVWPTSIGGDSVEANLLPACKECQKITKDTASWEWLNIHNFVFPASPSKKALHSVPRRVRFAKYYFDAVTLCDQRGLSLKEAFLQLGPMPSDLTHVNTGLPVTFFDLQFG